MGTPTGKKMLVMMKELVNSTDQAAYLIHKITGHNLHELQGKSKDDLTQILSTLISNMEKEDNELNWQNDKSSEVDTSKDASLQAKAAKGVINTTAGKKNLFSLANQVYEFIRIKAALNARAAMIKNVGTAQLPVNPMNAQSPTYSKADVHYSKLADSHINKIIDGLPTSPNFANDNRSFAGRF